MNRDYSHLFSQSSASTTDNKHGRAEGKYDDPEYETPYVELAEDKAQNDDKDEIKGSRSLIQGDLDNFNASLEDLRNTNSGQKNSYGGSGQLGYLQQFLENEGKKNDLNNQQDQNRHLKVHLFIHQFCSELDDNFDEMEPAVIADFLSRQERVAHGDNYLSDLVVQERAGLNAFIAQQKDQKRAEENTCWARCRRQILPIAAGLIIGASWYPWYLWNKARHYQSTKVNIDGTQPNVNARFAIKDEEQDVFMHDTLPYAGILLGMGLLAGGASVLALFNHHFVVKPLKDKIQGLHLELDRHKKIMQKMVNVLVNIPVGLATTQGSVQQTNSQNNMGGSATHAIKLNMGTLSVEAARRGAQMIVSPSSSSASLSFLSMVSSTSSHSFSSNPSNSVNSQISDSSDSSSLTSADFENKRTNTLSARIAFLRNSHSLGDSVSLSNPSINSSSSNSSTSSSTSLKNIVYR